MGLDLSTFHFKTDVPQKQSHTFTYCTASQNSSERSEEIKRSFNWTLERMQLLGKFINVLSGTLKQWNAFVSPDGGDIDYFSDLQHPFPIKSPESQDHCAAGRSLRAIRKTFGNLQDLLQKLELLRDDLGRDFKTVSGRFLWPGCLANYMIVSLHCAFPWKATMQTSMPHLPQHF
jgi:hypothetical protein